MSGSETATAPEGWENQPPPAPVPQRVSLRLPLARPFWTYAMLGAIILVFVAMTLAGGSETLSVLVRFGAKVNSRILRGEYWRFLTPMFLHIGLLHLAFNAWALYAIGGDVERVYGRSRFFVIYTISGIAATVSSFAFSSAISAGASGAVFGLLGALGVFFFIHRNELGRWGRSRLGNVALVLVLNLVYGSFATGIDNAAHMGGLVTGAILAALLCPRYRLGFTVAGPSLEDTNPLSRRWLVVGVALALVLVAAAGAVSLRSRGLSL